MSLVSIVRKCSVSKVTPELDHSVCNRTVHWGMQAAENGDWQLAGKALSV